MSLTFNRRSFLRTAGSAAAGLAASPVLLAADWRPMRMTTAPKKVIVVAAGEYRLIIWKTYKDEKSYYTEGETIVFKRPLGIPRNSVVLPFGFEVVSSSVATQVLMESNG